MRIFERNETFIERKKRIKTSRSTSSHQQGEVANKQKRVSNNSHLGEGTISATAILTSPPSHLRSSRSSLTSTATVILTSRLHLSYDPGLTFLPLHLRSSCSHLRLARFLLTITSLPLYHICSSSHGRCEKWDARCEK